MNNDLLSKVVEQSQPLLNTVAKANKLAVAELEKLVVLQTSTLACYNDLCLGQLKAASEIKDSSGLQSFYTSQAEALGSFRQKILDNGQALAELGNDFRNELGNLIKESLVGLTPKAVNAGTPKAA